MCSPYQRARPLVCWLSINIDVLPEFHGSLSSNQEAVIDAEVVGMKVDLEESPLRVRRKNRKARNLAFVAKRRYRGNIRWIDLKDDNSAKR